MILPKQGTTEHAEFLRKARDPSSVEAGVVRQLLEDSSNQVQGQVRAMLNQMIGLVPGQLFRDIGLFHEKFGLAPTNHPGHELPEDLLKFRIKFLYEELEEYCIAVGASVLDDNSDGVSIDHAADFDAERAFDALIDLCYVALGTAYLHRFPFNEGWSRVQEANMAKVRASGVDDPLSVRKHSADVVKPEGWRPPQFGDLL